MVNIFFFFKAGWNRCPVLKLFDFIVFFWCCEHSLLILCHLWSLYLPHVFLPAVELILPALVMWLLSWPLRCLSINVLGLLRYPHGALPPDSVSQVRAVVGELSAGLRVSAVWAHTEPHNLRGHYQSPCVRGHIFLTCHKGSLYSDGGSISLGRWVTRMDRKCPPTAPHQPTTCTCVEWMRNKSLLT